MPAPVVFEHVWKKFRQGDRHDSLRDLIPAAVGALVRGSRTDALSATEFWAVEDVTFEVPPGTALGIIGPNGAGKSTTLKLLTRILRPNRGHCEVRGRVGALIEVAAGFHPDLTGRENVYLQGAIMGMKRTEVTARFDEIVEFAGVSRFIDTQVKRYSSGMNARLGFSIAAHLRPDVLIIDEVLSVGDMAFQERCLERMRRFKRDGVTIVFVSHNLQAVVELCDRALYLNRRACALGEPTEVIGKYVRESFTPTVESSQGEVTIESVALRDEQGVEVTGAVEPGTPLRMAVTFAVSQAIDDLSFAFRLIRATDQLTVYDGHFSDEELGLASLSPGQRVTVEYSFRANVTRGQYYFDVFACYNPTQRFVARLRPAGHLTIAETRTWGGVADLAVSAALQESNHRAASARVVAVM
jgi:lipopolysaccharide transport system ATP-binding protein